MPTWGEILRELNIELQRIQQSGTLATESHWDIVRRRYLARAHARTGRAIILYATRWTQPSSGPPVAPELVSISNEDVQGMMEAVHGIQGTELDLILHSPGGSAEAAEALVIYLRSKFTHIRVIVPSMAKSAATMIACGADEVVMGAHSFLGPIDPQIVLQTALGPRMVPAQAIIDQFEQAKLECTDPVKIRAWLPMLSQYGPDLLMTCRNASKMSEDLVKGWLKSYMFRTDRKRARKAKEIASWLSNHANFMSHMRHISRDALRNKDLKITDLENDQELQDLYLSVFHATTEALTNSALVKIIENHLGKAFIKLHQAVMIPQIIPQVQPVFPPQPQPGSLSG